MKLMNVAVDVLMLMIVAFAVVVVAATFVARYLASRLLHTCACAYRPLL